MPYADRAACNANGFVLLHGVGTTVERPDHHRNDEHKPNIGGLFYDTDAAALLASDGADWRNATTGAIA